MEAELVEEPDVIVPKVLPTTRGPTSSGAPETGGGRGWTVEMEVITDPGQKSGMKSGIRETLKALEEQLRRLDVQIGEDMRVIFFGVLVLLVHFLLSLCVLWTQLAAFPHARYTAFRLARTSAISLPPFI